MRDRLMRTRNWLHRRRTDETLLGESSTPPTLLAAGGTAINTASGAFAPFSRPGAVVGSSFGIIGGMVRADTDSPNSTGVVSNKGYPWTTHYNTRTLGDFKPNQFLHTTAGPHNDVPNLTLSGSIQMINAPSNTKLSMVTFEMAGANHVPAITHVDANGTTSISTTVATNPGDLVIAHTSGYCGTFSLMAFPYTQVHNQADGTLLGNYFAWRIADDVTTDVTINFSATPAAGDANLTVLVFGPI